LIGTMILIWAVGLTREVVDILLEAAPKHIDMGKIVREVKKVGGVRDLHDLHVWTIASGIYAMSVHLVIKDQTVSRAGMILEEVNDLLRSKFGISHTTIQLECKRCKGPLVCSLSLEKLPRS
ncbi:MAG: cation transporter dimerization domain-containing protein, partial [Candidatus Hadarchaeales archaeon]